MLDLGDTITLTYPSKPASPATVTVTIGLPDGTATSPASALSGSYSFTPTQAGRHTVLWVSTGPSDAYSDSFDVADAASATIISLADAKIHLRAGSAWTAANDEDLRLFLAATTALVEHEVGPVVPASHVEIHDLDETIVLSKAPVMSLTSVAPTFPVVGGFFTMPTYQLEGPSGILRRQPLYFSSWGFDWGFSTSWVPYGLRLTITYMAGRPVVPAPLQAAARTIVENLWKSRRLAAAKPADGSDQMEQYGREVIPQRAVELMAPYRRAPMVV